MSASSCPGCTSSPISTCSLRISPDAFDLTSTSRIGSTVPVASALIKRVARTTWTVSTLEAASAASPLSQALAVTKRRPRTAHRPINFVIPSPPPVL